MVMDQLAVQDPVFMGRVTAEAVLAQDFKAIKAVMATKVVIISNIIRGVNNNIVGLSEQPKAVE